MPGTALGSEEDRNTPRSYRAFSPVGKMSIKQEMTQENSGEKKCWLGGPQLHRSLEKRNPFCG